MGGRTRNLSAVSDGRETAQAIARDAGVNLKDCYQCGKCSAGCPVASDADTTPRTIIRNLQLGQPDAAMESTMPWLCVCCGMCLARCPQKVDLPSLMRAVRKAAKSRGMVAIKEADKFADLFVDGIRLQGISDEAILAARFNLTTGHLFQDVGSVPVMLKLGMIAPGGHKLNDVNEVRTLMEKARQVDASKTASSSSGSQSANSAPSPKPKDASGTPTEQDSGSTEGGKAR